LQTTLTFSFAYHWSCEKITVKNPQNHGAFLEKRGKIKVKSQHFVVLLTTFDLLSTRLHHKRKTGEIVRATHANPL